MKIKCILLVFTINLFVTCNIFSQSITVTSVSKTQFCVGDEFTVDYTATGTFNDDNVFVVQLSYPDGNFNNFYNIGNLKTTNSGTISCKTPNDLSTNFNYKIRIISSKPYIVGTIYDNYLSIYAQVNPYFEPEKRGYLIGDEVIFLNKSSNATNFDWDFGVGASPSTFNGRTPPHVIYSNEGLKSVTLSAKNDGGCLKTYTLGNSKDPDNVLCLYSCKPKIDSNAVVITNDTSITYGNSDVWICSSGKCNAVFSDYRNFFIEPGGTLVYDRSFPKTAKAIYAKPGACIIVPEYLTFPIVHSNGISINFIDNWYADETYELICDDLEFDYSEAPEAGKIAQHLAVDDASLINNLNIFPNPSDGLINISLSSESPTFEISIIDVLGNEIYKEKINNSQTTWNGKIDLSGFSSGIYFVKIFDRNKSITKSIVLYN